MTPMSLGKKIAGAIVIAWFVIFVILAVFVGIPAGKGHSIYPLKDYPAVEGYTIAVKSESIRLFYLPLIKWDNEFVVYKGSLEQGAKFQVLKQEMQKEIESQHGAFVEHIPWQHRYGWLVGAIFIALVVLSVCIPTE